MIKARTALQGVRWWTRPRNGSGVERQRSRGVGPTPGPFLLPYCSTPLLLSLLRWRMSLFGSIQMGGSTLQAMQIGLQVVGNNIANANTPGYVRQEAIYSPAPVQRVGGLVLGTGVQVDSILQKVDKFVQERLVGAHGDRAKAGGQEQTDRGLETQL